MPLEGGFGLPFIIAGRPLKNAPAHGGGGWLTVSPGYFEVYRIPVVRGRTFTVRDDGAAPRVALINQSMARQYWPKGDPLTDRLIIGHGVGAEFEEGPRQIVGIVSDIRDGGLNRNPQPVMNIPTAKVNVVITALNARIAPISWIVRTRVAPRTLSKMIEAKLRHASGGMPVANIRTMDEVVVQSTARQDFNMLLLTIFGCSALLLAAVGIYGLMAYSVAQRTQEIGIRMALGAEVPAVRNLVVGQGMKLVLVGIAIGIVAAFGLTRLLATFLFGVKPLDPLTFAAVPVLLAAVAFVAVWMPARRATRIDPLEALRYE